MLNSSSKSAIAPAPIALVLLALTTLPGCSGFSCSGNGFEITTEETFPQEQMVDPAVKLRVTREGSEFLGAHGPELIDGVLGGGTLADDGWIDISTTINDFLIQNPLMILTVSARDVEAAAKLPNPDGLDIQFLDQPDRVRVIIDELWLRLEATVVDDLTNSACRVRGDVAPGGDVRMFTLRDVALDLNLAVSAEQEFDITVDLLNVDIVDSGIALVTDSADPWYYCNLPECSDGAPPQCGECATVCTAADFAVDVADYFVAAFDTLVAAAVEIAVNAILAEVGRIDGTIHPAILLGSLVTDIYDANPLAFGVRPSLSGFQVHDRSTTAGPGGDLDVSLVAGFGAQSPHSCIPALGPDPSFGASPIAGLPPTIPGSELAAGIPEGTVNQLLWGLYGSGGLCLSVDAATVSDLTNGALDLSVGLVSLLLPGLEEVAQPEAPLLIELRPLMSAADFPVVEMVPIIQTDGSEVATLTVALRNTGIGIYAAIDDHYVRLFEVTLDMAIAVTPEVTPDGGLGVGVDSIELSNIRESYDELFRDVELSAMLQFISELLTRVLVGNEIALPIPLDSLVESLLGVPLQIGLADFQIGGSADDWMSLSIGLALGQGASGGVVDTVAPHHPDGRLTIAHGEAIALEIANGLEEGFDQSGEIDLQWRVDGLGWSGLRAGPELTVESALLTPGAHTLEVRARRPGQHRSADPTPLSLSVHVGSPGLVDVPSDEPAVSGGACSVAGVEGSHTSSGLLGAALVLVVLVGCGRRRERIALLSLVVALGCDDSGADESAPCSSDRDCVQGQFCGCNDRCSFPLSCASSSDCCGGRACIDGVCDRAYECGADSDCALGSICADCQCRRAACASASDCPEPLTCAAGICAPAGHIPCAAACGEGEACIVERDVCVSAGNFCPGSECEAGEQLVMTQSDGLLGESCDFRGVECGCVQAPPLPEPRPGGWVGVAELSSGEVLVAAYEGDYGDLVTVRANADLKLQGVEFVDGVPDVRPTADPLGPRGGIGALGPDIGRHASATTTTDGSVVIASYDATEGALRMARLSPGSTDWTVFEVDSQGDAGRYADIAPMIDGRVVVAYQALSDDGLTTMLRVAASTVPTPAGAGDFSITNVEVAGGELPETVCNGECRDDEVCLAVEQRCARPSPPSSCAATCGLGFRCVSADCQSVSYAAEASLVGGTGVDPVIAVTGTDTVAIPFYRSTDGSLAIATGPITGPFDVTTLDAGSNRAGFGPTDVGREVAVDGDAGGLHLAYRDEISGALLYRTYDLTSGMLGEVEEVDAGGGADPPRRIGGVDLALGLIGDPRVAWQDASNGRLMLARRGQNGDWTSQVMDETESSGFSPSFSESGLILGFGRLRGGVDGNAPFREVGLVSVP